MDWSLEIAFHWPHDRFALGWEYMSPDDEHKFSTLKVYLFFITFIADK